MAVQIPRIERLQSSGSVSPVRNRIRQQDPNTSQDILRTTNNITNLANNIEGTYRKHEDNTINQYSAENDQEYSQWKSLELQKLKNNEGDPTDAYVQHEKDEAEKIEEILSKRGEVSDRVKRHLQSSMGKSTGTQRLLTLKLRAAQQSDYEDTVYNSSIETKRDSLSVNAGMIKAGDSDSYASYDENITDITTLVAQKAVRKGTAEVLPSDAKSWSHSYRDGDNELVKVKMTDFAKREAAKEIGKGVTSSIEVLLASGQTAEAKELNEKYSKHLTPDQKIKLAKKFKTEDISDKANKTYGKLRYKSDVDQVKAINNMKNEEERQKVIKLREADKLFIKKERERKENSNYEMLAKDVMNSKYASIAELEASQTYKLTFDNLNSKQQKAILDEIKAPKKSDPDAELASLNLAVTNGYAGLSPEGFMETSAGLNLAAKKIATREWKSANSQTGSRRSAILSKMRNNLTTLLVEEQFVTPDDFGKFSAREKRKLSEAYGELIQFVEDYSQGGNIPSDTEAFNFVKNFAVKKANDDLDNFRPVNPRLSQNKKVKSEDIPTEDRENYMMEYMKVNNGSVPSENDLNDYIQSQITQGK